MCPVYTHATRISLCIGPCNLFGSTWSMFSYNTSTHITPEYFGIFFKLLSGVECGFKVPSSFVFIKGILPGARNTYYWLLLYNNCLLDLYIMFMVAISNKGCKLTMC